MRVNRNMNTQHFDLKTIGLRETPAHTNVLAYLCSQSSPVDAADISTYLESQNTEVDIATIYRILERFYAKGILKRVEFQEGKFRYELTNREDHHHLICKKCGTIEDVSDTFMENIEKKITSEKKFLVQNHSLEFFGICANCQK